MTSREFAPHEIALSTHNGIATDRQRHFLNTVWICKNSIAAMPPLLDRAYGDRMMRALAWMICLVIMCTTVGADTASAQQAATGCSSEQNPGAAQTLRCRGGLTIVAEDGAKFTLQSPGGQADGVDLQSKALLVDAPR